MARIIGLRDLHICPLTKDDGVEAPTYGEVTKVPSLISMDIQDNTDSITFYSDDTAEQVIQAFSGKEVTIVLGYLPNEIEALISGNRYDKSTGVFTQSANAESPEIGLMFRAPKSKNGAFRYVALYKGVLSVDGSNYKTKEEGTESQNVTLKGVFMPLAYNGDVSIKVDTDNGNNSSIVSSWFTKPYVPNKPSSSALNEDVERIIKK